MVDWFGPSRRDRVQLVSILHSLGPTSVQGVAAALSWSERRTERTIESSVRHGDAPIDYDPARHTVRLGPKPHAPVPPPPAAVGVPGAAPPTRPAHPPTASTPPPPAPTLAPRCPGCHTRLTPAGMPGLYVCSGCGELHHLDRSPRPAAAPVPAAPPTPPPTPRPSPRPAGDDRRSQELLAAYVTSQPIPCPRCRTGMRHRGVAEYYCPACGAGVSFDRSGGVSRSAAPASPPPA